MSREEINFLINSFHTISLGFCVDCPAHLRGKGTLKLQTQWTYSRTSTTGVFSLSGLLVFFWPYHAQALDIFIEYWLFLPGLQVPLTMPLSLTPSPTTTINNNCYYFSVCVLKKKPQTFTFLKPPIEGIIRHKGPSGKEEQIKYLTLMVSEVDSKLLADG